MIYTEMYRIEKAEPLMNCFVSLSVPNNSEVARLFQMVSSLLVSKDLSSFTLCAQELQITLSGLSWGACVACE